MVIGIAVKARILELCKTNKISVNRLATISGVSQSTINNIVSGRNNSATVSTIKKLCDGLGISVIDFFNCPLLDVYKRQVFRKYAQKSRGDLWSSASHSKSCGRAKHAPTWL